MARRYWLFKSEPDEFSLDDLRRSRGGRALWDGVRNYQARNLLRDEVQLGDGVLFYHSRIAEPAIAGTAEVVRTAYPDPTAFDPKDKHFDPKSDAEKPRWYAVDVKYQESFAVPLTREVLKNSAQLAEMMVLRRGMRLSIQPVTGAEWKAVQRLAARLARG